MLRKMIFLIGINSHGKPLTEEHKNKIKETKRKNPQYFSEECRQKMSIAKKKYWENKKLEGHGES